MLLDAELLVGTIEAGWGLLEALSGYLADVSTLVLCIFGRRADAGLGFFFPLCLEVCFRGSLAQVGEDCGDGGRG